MSNLGDFSHQAQAYAAARPSYPDALLDRLIAHVGVGPGDPVADLGAGTGISTVLLADRGFKVTAIEPNRTMREHAPERPNTAWLEGTFEHAPLPDASQVWVVAAQAFHWADPARALPEMRRILRPGGWFTVMWNNRLNDREPTLARVWGLVCAMAPDFDDNYRDNQSWPVVLTSTGDFDRVHEDAAEHTVAMPRDRFVNLWRSHNRLTIAAGPRFPQLIDAIERDLDQHGVTQVDVPYACRSWTVRRGG